MSDNNIEHRESLIETRQRLVEGDIARFQSITLDLFKWVTGATLTLNGGPLLAMLGAESLRPFLNEAGLYFAVGVGISIFGNLLLIKGLAQAGQALFDAHWTGESTKHDNYDDVAPGSDSNRWTTMAAVCLGLSIVAFIVGVISLGDKLVTEKPTSAATTVGKVK